MCSLWLWLHGLKDGGVFSLGVIRVGLDLGRQVCVCTRSVAQSCLTLFDLMDCSPPGSSVHGILQSRILEWIAISSSRGSSQPRDRTGISFSSCIGGRILYHQHHLGSPLDLLQQIIKPPLFNSFSIQYSNLYILTYTRKTFLTQIDFHMKDIYFLLI